MGAEEPLLRVEGVGKAYFSNRVLKNVNFTLGKGRILGLVGENGAGKSTLMNILFGMRVIQETGGYEGKILIDGSEVSFRSPMDALKAGIGHGASGIFPDSRFFRCGKHRSQPRDAGVQSSGGSLRRPG